MRRFGIYDSSPSESTIDLRIFQLDILGKRVFIGLAALTTCTPFYETFPESSRRKPTPRNPSAWRR